jgi:zinc transporter
MTGEPIAGEGLVCAYLLDRQGHGQAIGWEGIRAWRPESGLLWVHLDFTADAARRWVADESGLGENIIEAMLAEDGRPRGMQFDDGWLVMLRGVNTNPGSVAEDMVAIRVWLAPDRIISTRRRRLQSVRDLRAEIEAGRAPRSPGEFLIYLLDGLSGRIASAIDGLEAEIDVAEPAATSGAPSPALQLEIASLRRRTARMRRHLSPQRDALERVARQGGGGLGEDDLWMIREASDRTTRALEDLDLARERAMVAHEEFQARLAQQQNSRIYVLSIVAAIFLPLSFLTGVFGMNVAGLPGIEDPRAFAAVTGLMGALAVGLVLLFRWQRWF